ncbi:MAG: hypothetical protein PHX40_04825, partial [Bacilli bacterium]|nr:hypothetical protein [Bacilli bacterium]
ESEGAMQSAPFVLTGFGAGIIGVGAAGIFRKKVFDKNPEKAKTTINNGDNCARVSFLTNRLKTIKLTNVNSAPLIKCANES